MHAYSSSAQELLAFFAISLSHSAVDVAALTITALSASALTLATDALPRCASVFVSIKDPIKDVSGPINAPIMPLYGLLQSKPPLRQTALNIAP